ncbi:MAG: hypothetical protein KatS3mg015_2455 [Fimbriimonadales bacterium]|nr:MAG: hypothetical protein KatS3mg015_2455 [Fimbriimonadales bacterium]
MESGGAPLIVIWAAWTEILDIVQSSYGDDLCIPSQATAPASTTEHGSFLGRDLWVWREYFDVMRLSPPRIIMLGITQSYQEPLPYWKVH